VCLSVREDIPGTTGAIFTNFLCVLPMSVARSSSGTLRIGRIAASPIGGKGVSDGSAQHGRSVIYNCFVFFVCLCCVRFSFFSTKPRDWLLVRKNVSEITYFVSNGI